MAGGAHAPPPAAVSRRPLRVLICAFGPFPGVAVNPSARFARAVAGLRRPALADVRLQVEILPTHWVALERLDAVLAREEPDAVLLLGVAARRQRVCVERRAVNATDSRPDAARRHAPARRVLHGAEPDLASTADVMRLLAAMRRFGVPARLSRDAGRYLCNASYFRALSAAQTRGGGRIPVAFIHLPRRTGRPRGTTASALGHALSALLVSLVAQARRRV